MSLIRWKDTIGANGFPMAEEMNVDRATFIRFNLQNHLSNDG